MYPGTWSMWWRSSWVEFVCFVFCFALMGGIVFVVVVAAVVVGLVGGVPMPRFDDQLGDPAILEQQISDLKPFPSEAMSWGLHAYGQAFYLFLLVLGTRNEHASLHEQLRRGLSSWVGHDHQAGSVGHEAPDPATWLVWMLFSFVFFCWNHCLHLGPLGNIIRYQQLIRKVCKQEAGTRTLEYLIKTFINLIKYIFLCFLVYRKKELD